MDTTSAVSAANANSYASTSTASTRKSASSTANASSSVATDTYTPSAEASAAASGEAASKAKGAWGGFDAEAFQNDMREKLLASIRDSQKSLKDAGVTFYGGENFLYDLAGADTKSYTDEQMGVGKEWGADATSSRLVDFALAFRGSGTAKGLTDEEFVEKIRDAIKQGFKLAKGDLGDLPGPTGKLFNDTYQATMDKLDKALEDMKSGSGGSATAATEGASAKTQASSSQSTFSVVA